VRDTHLKAKARELRSNQALTIDQIGLRLALPRSTVYSWVRDLPIERPRVNAGQKRGAAAMQARFRLLREEAYEEGRREFAALARDPTFRDFVCMYIGEGTKRQRATVAICNSDPAVVILGAEWIRRFSKRKLDYQLQFHVDQDPRALAGFWATKLQVAPDQIRLQRKSNSGQMAGRSWRCHFGVLTVRSHDTLLRARLQGWMDEVRGEWVGAPLVDRELSQPL
jgi:hypothetical protein